MLRVESLMGLPNGPSGSARTGLPFEVPSSLSDAFVTLARCSVAESDGRTKSGRGRNIQTASRFRSNRRCRCPPRSILDIALSPGPRASAAPRRKGDTFDGSMPQERNIPRTARVGSASASLSTVNSRPFRSQISSIRRARFSSAGATRKPSASTTPSFTSGNSILISIVARWLAGCYDRDTYSGSWRPEAIIHEEILAGIGCARDERKRTIQKRRRLVQRAQIFRGARGLGGVVARRTRAREGFPARADSVGRGIPSS